MVYPAHGVGQIVAVEDQEVAGFRLELYVISFSKDKMTLRVPTSKVTGVGLRRISDADAPRRALEILAGRARVKRTMWSRRAQEYESKINSGDIGAIAEVIRDLYRSEAQPEQSYSERQLYEAALDRLVREIAAVQKLNEIDALKAVDIHLQKGHGRSKSSPAAADEPGDARSRRRRKAANFDGDANFRQMIGRGGAEKRPLIFWPTPSKSKARLAASSGVRVFAVPTMRRAAAWSPTRLTVSTTASLPCRNPKTAKARVSGSPRRTHSSRRHAKGRRSAA